MFSWVEQAFIENAVSAMDHKETSYLTLATGI